MEIVGGFKPLKRGKATSYDPWNTKRESIIPWKWFMINENDNVRLSVQIPLINLTEL